MALCAMAARYGASPDVEAWQAIRTAVIHVMPLGMEDRGQIKRLGVGAMTIGDPIEEQCVKMFAVVYGNPAHTLDDSRRAFWQQDKAIIDGWERLARTLNKVTTAQTLEHVLEPYMCAQCGRTSDYPFCCCNSIAMKGRKALYVQP